MFRMKWKTSIRNSTHSLTLTDLFRILININKEKKNWFSLTITNESLRERNVYRIVDIVNNDEDTCNVRFEMLPVV